jgi:hypothetical protein
MQRPFSRAWSAPEQSADWQARGDGNILEVKRALFLVLVALAHPAFGQVYSWQEAGATRISNEPPAWYKSYEPVRGPRTLVTTGPRVIDDTALPMEKRLALRPKPPQKPAPKRWISP